MYMQESNNNEGAIKSKMAKEGSGAKLYLSQTKFLLPLARSAFSPLPVFSWNAYSFLLPATFATTSPNTHTHTQYPYVQIQSILQGIADMVLPS